MISYKGISPNHADEVVALNNLLDSIKRMNYFSHDAIASMIEVCNPISLGYSEKLCDAIHNLMQACMNERDTYEEKD